MLQVFSLEFWEASKQLPLQNNNKNTTKRRQICSKLTIKAPKRRRRRLSGVLNVNFEHTSHLL